MSDAIPIRYSATETFDIGRGTGEAVSIDDEGALPFTGPPEKVEINIQPPQLSSEAQEKTKKLEHDAAIATQ